MMKKEVEGRAVRNSNAEVSTPKVLSLKWKDKIEMMVN